MSQTHKRSVAESFTNVAVGWTINYCLNMILFPLFVGRQISPANNILMGTIFTVVSVVRSYVIRRSFNRREA